MSAVRNALDHAFVRARDEGRGALIPYLTAGFPEIEGWVDLAVTVLEAGADALEIGVPFSDPLLDGPAIQRSQQAALDAGVTPADCLAFAGAIQKRSSKPILLMGAYNPVLAYGIAAYCRAAAGVGVTALIVPDLPLDEQDELRSVAGDAGLHVIQMAAPTSSGERLRAVCAAASGFVYCISVAGVTGARSGVAELARPLVERVRHFTDVPVAVGFGIGTPESARAVTEFADAAVVGTAMITLLAETPAEERLPAAKSFVAGLSQAIATEPKPA